MAFKDLGDWADLGGLKLPINGKVYGLPPIDAELGPRLQALVSAGVDVAQGRGLSDGDQEVLDDLGERALFRDILGDVYDEMVADKVPWTALKLAAMTSMFDAVLDRKTAEKYWETQGKPPARTAKRATKATGSPTKRVSSGGTTSRRKPAAKGARGRKSSGTGG
jgi:hypothetical protein